MTKPGRTVTVCTGNVFAVIGAREKLVATMLVTIMTVGGQRDFPPGPSTTAVRDIGVHERSPSPRWCPCRRLRAITHGLRAVVVR